MANAPGVADMLELQASGATPDQINSWREYRTQQLVDVGATDEQIAAYFGRGQIQSAAPDAFVDAEFAEPVEGEAPKSAKGFREAFQAGFQSSLSGIAKRNALPDIVIDDESGFMEAVVAGITQGIGDLPVSLPAFIAGSGPGAALGGAAGAGASRNPSGAAAGTAIGALFAGGAVSGFVTEATRSAYIDFLQHNDAAAVRVSPQDFAARVTAAVLRKETLQAGGSGAIIGGTVGLAGGPLVRGPVSKAVGNTLAREIVVTGAETTAAVATASALAGELPDAKDFAVAATAITGFKAGELGVRRTNATVRGAQQRLQEHWKATGERPAEAVKRAKRDPVFRQQVVAGDKAVSPRTELRDGPDIAPLQVSEIKAQEPLFFDPARLTPEAVKAAREAQTNHTAVVEAATPRPKKAATEAPQKAVTDAVAAAREGIRSKIKSADKVRRSPKEMVDWLRYQYVNDLQFMVSESRRAYKDATGAKLDIESNPGELARLAFGAHAKADVAIRDGAYAPDGKTKIVDGFEPILKRLPKDSVDDFLDYAIARRVVEKHAQELETGFDYLDADLIRKDGDARPEFVKAFDDLQTWQNTMLDRLVDSGLVGKDAVGAMKEANRDYVPFARVLDNEKAPAGVTARGLPVRRATKAFTGSERDIFNPFEVMIKNRYALQQLADNNVARLRLVDFNEGLPEQFQFLKKAKKQITITELKNSDAQVKKFLADNGLEDADVSGVMVYRAANKRIGEGEFIVFEEGKPVTYVADNPDLVLSLQSLDRKTMGTLTKMMAVPSSFLRAGTTTDPAFIAKATIRDQLSSVLINSFKVLPIVDAVAGITHIAGKSPAFRRWIDAGGANSALLSLDRQILGGLLSKNRAQLPIANAWNAVTTPYRLMAAASTLAENSMRVGQFVRAEKTAGSQVAALRSRDVALDFARMGANVRAFNMISAWTGATINGIDRSILAFKNAPLQTMTKTMALVTLPSLYLWWANKDKGWYKELEDWEKAVFWHIDTGMKDNRGSPVVLRVPMPQQFGALFGFLPIAMMEEFGKTDPQFGKTLDEALGTAFVGVDDFVPVAISPLFEIGANYNYFTEAPLVSESLQRQLPEYRYTPYTTQSAIAVSKLIAPFSGGLIDEKFTTPIAIEYMIRQYSGAIGMNTVKAVDAGLRKAGALPDPTKPSETFADMPIVGGFFLRVPAAKRSISTFYDNAEKVDQIKASMKARLQEGDSDEAERILNIYGAPLLNPAKARDALGNLRKVAIGVHLADDIPAEEKRQLIDDLMFAQMEIARAFNEAYSQARAAQKEVE